MRGPKEAFRYTRPEAVALAKELARKKPKGGKLSLRAVSAAMATQGCLNERGQPRGRVHARRVSARSPRPSGAYCRGFLLRAVLALVIIPYIVFSR